MIVGCSIQPSVLALAVIGCELKLLCSDWLTILVTLQDKVQVVHRHDPHILYACTKGKGSSSPMCSYNKGNCSH